MSLGQRVMRAMGWSAAAKVGFQIITWAMTLAVIRVLSPDDYGLMALSMVCINLLAGFCNLGLGDALVQREHTPKPLVASVFGLLLLISVALTLLISMAAYLAWTSLTSADVLVIGWWLGPADLGLYSVALNFAAMPLNKIAPIANSVAFPAFALVQGNLYETRFYALKAMRLMTMVAVPVFFGISAIAPEIVNLVFGPQWTAAIPMLTILALAMTFRAILLVVPNFLQGIGDARAGFWCTLSGAVLFPPAFIIGCAWGVEGVYYALLLGHPVVFGIYAWIAA